MARDYTKEPVKVITSFSGYDSQCMALDRIKENIPGFDYELMRWCEIEPNAIKAHNLVYPQWSDRNLGDITKVDWKKVHEEVGDVDLFTYSSPCFVAGTRVLTSQGYKSIENLSVYDTVYTRDGSWQKVLAYGSDGGVAATLKTSNHREKNITFPRGGRGEMGVLEYERETFQDNRQQPEEPIQR